MPCEYFLRHRLFLIAFAVATAFALPIYNAKAQAKYPPAIQDLCDRLEGNNTESGIGLSVRNSCRKGQGQQLVKSKEEKERELLALRCHQVATGTGHMGFNDRVNFTRKCQSQPPAPKEEKCFWITGRMRCSLPADHPARPVTIHHDSVNRKRQQILDMMHWAVPRGMDPDLWIQKLQVTAQQREGYRHRGDSKCWTFRQGQFYGTRVGSSLGVGISTDWREGHSKQSRKCMENGGVIDAIWDW